MLPIQPTPAYPTRLSPTHEEIRLLTLYPSPSAPEDSLSPIQCHTTVVSLLSSPSPLYEALSYVWGDPFNPQTITLNSHPFYVTSALNTALLHLRSRTEERRFWVDALCINQADVEERNEQVRLMGRIYAGARRVLVWLGAPEEDGRDEEAFEAMRGVVQGKGLGVEARKMEELFDWFLRVMERPWFQRMWIMQELALASQEVRVGCGRWWVDWETFVGAWKLLARTEFEKMGLEEQIVRRHGGEGLDGGEEVKVLMMVKLDLLDDLRRVVVEHRGQSLRQLLLTSRTSQATEPRDRVYALRSMMREEDRDSIVVDYRKSIPVVFAEAVAHVFDKGQGPYFLSGLLLPGPNSESGFPSWVPDFTAQVAYEAGRPGPLALHPPQGTSASGGGFDCVNGEVLEDMKTLKIEGLFLDIVEDVLVFDITFEGCLQQLPQVEALADQARRRTPVDTTLRPYFQSFKQEEPLWRTLVCNKNRGTDPAPIFYEDAYEVLRGRRDASPEYVERGQEAMDQFIQDYSWRLRNILPSRAFFTTESGFVGIGTPETRKGDLVTIWFGAPVPFVVRPRGEFYSVVGIAYVAGIMDGGMVDELYCEDLVDLKSFLVQ